MFCGFKKKKLTCLITSWDDCCPREVSLVYPEWCWREAGLAAPPSGCLGNAGWEWKSPRWERSALWVWEAERNTSGRSAWSPKTQTVWCIVSLSSIEHPVFLFLFKKLLQKIKNMNEGIFVTTVKSHNYYQYYISHNPHPKWTPSDLS